MTPLLRCAVLALALLLPATAQADGFVRELRLGVLAHDVPDLWSGFSVEEAEVAINVEALLSPSMPFLFGSIMPAIGASIAAGDGTSSAYADLRWMMESSSGWFFGLGIGAAIHNGDTDATDLDSKWLGSRVLFHIPVEIGFRFDARNSVSAYFEHMSNASLADQNEGLDRLGLRYGYRF